MADRNIPLFLVELILENVPYICLQLDLPILYLKLRQTLCGPHQLCWTPAGHHSRGWLFSQKQRAEEDACYVGRLIPKEEGRRQGFGCAKAQFLLSGPSVRSSSLSTMEGRPSHSKRRGVVTVVEYLPGEGNIRKGSGGFPWRVVEGPACFNLLWLMKQGSHGVGEDMAVGDQGHCWI